MKSDRIENIDCNGCKMPPRSLSVLRDNALAQTQNIYQARHSNIVRLDSSAMLRQVPIFSAVFVSDLTFLVAMPARYVYTEIATSWMIIPAVVDGLSASLKLGRSGGSAPSSTSSEKNPEAMFDGRYVSLTPRIGFMLTGIRINSILLLIRAVYRMIEPSDGWNGSTIRTEAYFNVFDALFDVAS
ncbi:uncharacterized protein EI90DRAFT_3150042 [Cantharellus anzutake]|uniref:uncharacterized protein n=1 Tax=Cantharellus anzutake TaxID=1750568 RepID=UPI0019082207|nr:uncharacterized protein EI90DRAFT_3150042 [Cantharellus anzutake]KAF8343049.1 hypothetical protein EI90DRAFT_3150042 [Cantharellus anzutake]